MGAPSVSYKQVVNPSPKVTGTLQGLQSTVRYVVSWKDAFSFANDVLGLNDGKPWNWPASPNMRAVEARIDPVAVKGNPEADGSTPGTFYAKAYVDVTFASVTRSIPQSGTIDQPVADQFDPANPVEMSSYRVTYSAEMIKVPSGSLRWSGFKSDGTVQLVDTDISLPEAGGVYLRSPTFNLDFTLHNCLQLTYTNIINKVGKVNDVATFGCDPETLLFDGLNTARREMSNGLPIVDITLNYKWRSVGWNVAMTNKGQLLRYTKQNTDLLYQRTKIAPLDIILPSQRWKPYDFNGRPGR